MSKRLIIVITAAAFILCVSLAVVGLIGVLTYDTYADERAFYAEHSQDFEALLSSVDGFKCVDGNCLQRYLPANDRIWSQTDTVFVCEDEESSIRVLAILSEDRGIYYTYIAPEYQRRSVFGACSCSLSCEEQIADNWFLCHLCYG